MGVPPQTWQICAFDWAGVAITAILVGIRLYVQFHFRYKPWREVFVIAAWLFLLGWAICGSIMNDLNWYNPNFNPQTAPLPDWQVIASLKMQWTNTFFSFCCPYACKAALLIFYGDLTPKKYFPKTWWAIAVCWFFNVAGFGYCVLYQLLRCWPFSTNFSLTTQCRQSLALNLTNTVLHLFSDLLVFLVPFVILRNLGVDTKTYRATWWMFGMGTINIGFALFLALNNFWMSTKYDPSRPVRDLINYMTSLQLITAIIIVCMPHCRRLWNGMHEEDMRPIRQGAAADPEAGGGSLEHRGSEQSSSSIGKNDGVNVVQTETNGSDVQVVVQSEKIMSDESTKRLGDGN